MRVGQKVYDKEGLDGRCFELVDVVPSTPIKALIGALRLLDAEVGDFVNVPLVPSHVVTAKGEVLGDHVTIGNMQFIRRS
jgi:hypothetical protein